VYNPYAHSGDRELADKALAGESFTEPHDQRQAQRYLGYAVRAMRDAGVAITSRSIMAHLEPAQLEVTTCGLQEEPAAEVHRHLDTFTERQRRDLAGVRDRLSILGESDVGRWLEPERGGPVIDLPRIAAHGSIANVCLESDGWPLLGQMMAAARPRPPDHHGRPAIGAAVERPPSRSDSWAPVGRRCRPRRSGFARS